MTGSGRYPQTRLEQVAHQLRYSIAEFAKHYAATSQQLAKAGHGPVLTVSRRQVRRWLAGELIGLPHLSACRVLDQMFGEPAEQLFGPPKPVPGTQIEPAPRHDVAVTTPASAPVPASPLAVEREVMMAAAESARFGQFAEQNNVGHIPLSSSTTTSPASSPITATDLSIPHSWRSVNCATAPSNCWKAANRPTKPATLY